MAIAPSALSLAANELRTFLATISDLAPDRVLISHPKEAVQMAETEADAHHLNLFFYQVDYGAFPADGVSADPFYVRLHCLVTALSADDSSSGGASAGENDLRLLGEVMRLLHEKPGITVRNNGTIYAELQVVPHPLSLDDINRIWSTQADTPYRLSIAYELALVPIPMVEVADRSLRVGLTAVEARPTVAAPTLPATGFGFEGRSLQVARVTVSSERDDWAPQIAFESGGSLEYTLALSAEALPLTLNLLVAGAPGQSVSLKWEVWSSEAGWQELAESPSENVVISTDTIDPDNVDPSAFHALTLPLSAAGQAMLYAVREVLKPGQATPLTFRSNPLLVTVYAPTSP